MSQLALDVAHTLARMRPGVDMDNLTRFYTRYLTPGEQLLCRAELHACRQAKRGASEARIT